MSRAERVCAGLPPWMLRRILTLPLTPSWWWFAAWTELWRRHVGLS